MVPRLWATEHRGDADDDGVDDDAVGDAVAGCDGVVADAAAGRDADGY